MGLFKNLLIKLRSGLSSPDKWFSDMMNGGGSQSHAGVLVNEETAMNLSAVFCAVNIISGTVMQLPLLLYKNDAQGNKKRDKNNPYYKIIHKMANPRMTIPRFKQTMTAHVVSWGNAYAFIDWGGDGKIKGLYPLSPDRVTLKVFENENETGYKIFYEYRLKNGRTVTYDESEIFHMAGLGYDGIQGYSVITLARESIGLGLSTEEFGARYFGEGSHPGLVITHPQKLDSQVAKNMREMINEKYSGLGKAHKIMLLQDGMKPEPIDFSPEDSQFLETRKFQTVEIARWFNLPPHMLKDLDRATFSNIEHQSMEFINYNMGVWLILWESELNKLFFGDSDEYFVEFLRDSFLRGDTLNRYDAFGKAILSGFMTPNEARERENWPKLDGGDKLYMPLNMIPMELSGQDVQNNEPQPSAEQQKSLFKTRLNDRFMGLYKDAAGRFVRKEVNDIRNQIKKGITAEWLTEYYKNAQDKCEKSFLPVIEAHSKEITEFNRNAGDFDAIQYSNGVSARICQNSLETLKNPNSNIEATLHYWENTKSSKIAEEEINILWNRLEANK